MATSEPRLTALKIAHKGEIHRIRVELSTFNLAQLTDLFSQTFRLAPNAFVIQYTDAEGDKLNVSTDAEYAEACRVFVNGADDVKAMRFEAVPRTHIAFQENVAEPILEAIDKLVESLNTAMDKVKQDEWAQRAQSGVQTGVEQTNAALLRAAQDARESFAAARHSINEIPFDQILKETTEGIKSAAEGINQFAQEIVGEIKTFSQRGNEQPNQTEVATPEPEQNATEAPKEEAAEPAQAVPAEAEWEEVVEATPAVVEVAVVAEPVVAAAPVLSEGELKWADQLAMMRDILPGFNAQRAVDFLEQSHGNVEVVLNALMEEQ